jgi:predicted nuclease of predicted toxin-antitoxin system
MTLRVVVDVNLSPEWVAALTQVRWETVHWSEVGDPSAPDQVIMDWARARGFVVFTNDLDFSTMLALSHVGGPSVIQLRGPRVLPEQMGTHLIGAIQRCSADLAAGALVVVEPGRSRVRVLPL